MSAANPDRCDPSRPDEAAQAARDVSTRTPEQQRSIDCADTWLRGQLLPSYSEALSALRQFDQAEARAVDRHSREHLLAHARRRAQDVLRRAG